MLRFRGYALPLVILLTGILAAAFTLYAARLEGMTETQRLALKRRQAFYAADAVARAAVEVASTELLRLPQPGPEVEADEAALDAFLRGQAAQVQSALDARRADYTPDDYVVHSSVISDLGNRSVAELTTGPFKGMVALQQPFAIGVEVSHDNAGGAVAAMKSQVVRGTISMFQFFTFIDGYAYLYTGSGTKYAGRTHANGDICIGSGNGFYVEKVTASGGFYVSRSRGCRKEKRYHESERSAIVATRPLVDGLSQLACNIGDTTPARCNGLWARAGTSGTGTNQFDRDGNNDANDGAPFSSGTDRPLAEWRSGALTRWNGQVQDSAHGVPFLRVPITGTPVTQAGRDGSHNLVPNNAKSRFLVDPILPTEPADVRAQKLAFKADLRILNGVWYVRDQAAPERLGRPIWSDHPGTYRRADREDTGVETAASLDGVVRPVAAASSNAGFVGQRDLFGNTPRPQRYSYYRTGTTTDELVAVDVARRPVISYGNLAPVGSGTSKRWYPGYLDYNGTRWVTTSSTTPLELLQGTRSGFRDGWMQVATYRNDTDAGNAQRDNLGIPAAALASNVRRSFMFNILPINFDVEAFAAALRDGAATELGSYFPLGTFNGIVWIGATWPGIEQGYSATPTAARAPEFWPFQGRQVDVNQPAAGADAGTGANQFSTAFVDASEPLTGTGTGANTRRPRVATRDNIATQVFQRALPSTLCTDGTSGVFASSTGSSAQKSLNNTIAEAPFSHTSCARYRDSTDADFDPDVVADQRLYARPNALRIHNGRHIDRAVFPRGLTIATNLPTYLLGDYNSTSVPADRPADARSIITTTVEWRPALVAADTIAYQSSNWSDESALWNVPINTSNTNRQRDAGPTTYTFQALSGWLESDGRGNRDEVTYFTRLLEYWGAAGASRTERGSRVIGFASSFGLRFDWNGESNSDNNTGKVGAYDYNLDLPENQPPGSPRFQVTAIQTFVRN